MALRMAPFDSTKSTPIQDMNNERNSKRQSSKRKGSIQERHLTLLVNRRESAPQLGSGNDAAAGKRAGLMSEGIDGIKLRGWQKGGYRSPWANRRW
jgi:hypothetical protein